MAARPHVLVTGANGFVGRHLCPVLKESGLRLSCVSRHLLTAAPGYYALDLLDLSAVRYLMTELAPDCVIHLAASLNRGVEPSLFRDTFDTNVRIAWNMIEACQMLPHFKRFVFVGSCDEYGRAEPPFIETQRPLPTSAYALSKLTITQALGALHESFGFPAVILRPTIIYGPGQRGDMFLPSLIRKLLAGQSYAMTKGEQTRDFLYVGDLVAAILKVIHADVQVDGSIINLGYGQSHLIKTVVDMVLREIPRASISQVQYGAMPYRGYEVMRYAVNIERAATLLEWQPIIGMELGLRATIDFYRHLEHSFD